MKTVTEYEYDIGAWFITALLYGDLSGIDDKNDLKRVKAFIEEIGVGTIEVIETEKFFDRCDITGMMSDCVKIRVTYFNN